MSQNPQEKPRKLLEMREEEKKPISIETIKKEIREWVISLVSAFLLVYLISTFLFTIIRVDGGSMLDTLKDGDRLGVNVLDMRMNGPQRYDIVITRYPGRSENFVKRVIGLPGDTIQLKGGVLYINGEAVHEEYLTMGRAAKFHSASSSWGPIEIPEGQYFVMGDNRDYSNDSRAVGLIERDMFIGKVEFVFWPFDRIQGVN